MSEEIQEMEGTPNAGPPTPSQPEGPMVGVHSNSFEESMKFELGFEDSEGHSPSSARHDGSQSQRDQLKRTAILSDPLEGKNLAAGSGSQSQSPALPTSGSLAHEAPKRPQPAAAVKSAPADELEIYSDEEGGDEEDARDERVEENNKEKKLKLRRKTSIAEAVSSKRGTPPAQPVAGGPQQQPVVIGGREARRKKVLNAAPVTAGGGGGGSNLLVSSPHVAVAGGSIQTTPGRHKTSITSSAHSKKKFRNLDTSVYCHIEGYLPLKSALTMSAVCQRWRTIIFSTAPKVRHNTTTQNNMWTDGPMLQASPPKPTQGTSRAIEARSANSQAAQLGRSFNPGQGDKIQRRLNEAKMDPERLAQVKEQARLRRKKDKVRRKKYDGRMKKGRGRDSEDQELEESSGDDLDDSDEESDDPNDDMKYDSVTLALRRAGVHVKDESFRREGGIVCFKWMAILITVLSFLLTFINAASTAASSDATMAAIVAPCGILAVYWMIQSVLNCSVFRQTKGVVLIHLVTTAVCCGLIVLLGYAFTVVFVVDTNRQITAETFCTEEGKGYATNDPAEEGIWTMVVTDPKRWTRVSHSSSNYAPSLGNSIKIYESFPGRCKVITVGRAFAPEKGQVFVIARRSLFFSSKNTLNQLDSYPTTEKAVKLPQHCEDFSDVEKSCSFISPSETTLTSDGAVTIIVIVYLVFIILLVLPMTSVWYVSRRIRRQQRIDRVVSLEAQQRDWQQQRDLWIRAHR